MDENKSKSRITIRVSDESLSFSMAGPNVGDMPMYKKYDFKRGISASANLRDALKTEVLPQSRGGALLMVDSPEVMMPLDRYYAGCEDVIYGNTITGQEGCRVESMQLPRLSIMSLFAVNNDLRMVVEDYFGKVKIIPVGAPVWDYYHRRNISGIRHCMYLLLHDGKMDLFSFDRNRFKFFNAFPAGHTANIIYYVMQVWQLTGMKPDLDALYILGDGGSKEEIKESLKKYLQNVFCINPSADFNRAPATKINDMEYDLMTLYSCQDNLF